MWKYDYVRKFPDLARVAKSLHQPIYRAAIQRTFFTPRMVACLAIYLSLVPFVTWASDEWIPTLQLRHIDGRDTFVRTSLCRNHDGRAEVEQIAVAAPEGMLSEAEWEAWCRRTIDSL